MPGKPLIYIGLVIGSTIGTYIPALWGDGVFSGWSIFLGTVGAFAGVWVGYKMAQKYF